MDPKLKKVLSIVLVPVLMWKRWQGIIPKVCVCGGGVSISSLHLVGDCEEFNIYCLRSSVGARFRICITQYRSCICESPGLARPDKERPSIIPQ